MLVVEERGPDDDGPLQVDDRLFQVDMAPELRLEDSVLVENMFVGSCNIQDLLGIGGSYVVAP